MTDDSAASCFECSIKSKMPVWSACSTTSSPMSKIWDIVVSVVSRNRLSREVHGVTTPFKRGMDIRVRAWFTNK